MAAPVYHTPLEDAQGILFGTAMCAFALVILQGLGLVTGQTAGLALVIAYAGGWNFGVVFFLVNLPFFWLALQRMGPRFTLKTVVSIGLLSLFSGWLPGLVEIEWQSPLLGVSVFGMIVAAGMVALFRHGASLGGVGILGLYLQDRTGFRAGWTQLIFDAGVFGAALFVLPLEAVGYSLVGAVIVNVLIAINHRRDHYVAL